MADRLVLRQTLRYDYASPIARLDHHLMVLPPARHGDQVRTVSSLEVRGTRPEVTETVDAFGNVAVRVRASRVQACVEFVVHVAVQRSEGLGASAAAGDCGRLLAPSPLTEPDAVLGEVASGLVDSGDSGIALAERVNGWVAGALRYRHDVTGVHTTAAQALAVGAGVCQDYAHVMLALCRLCRLPARYVSGHMVGEGGSHAWVEVLLPSATDPSSMTTVAFDPTNDRRAGHTYLTVAVGRDYADVAPTHGTYCGPAGGRLSTAKTLEHEALELIPC